MVTQFLGGAVENLPGYKPPDTTPSASDLIAAYKAYHPDQPSPDTQFMGAPVSQLPGYATHALPSYAVEDRNAWLKTQQDAEAQATQQALEQQQTFERNQKLIQAQALASPAGQTALQGAIGAGIGVAQAGLAQNLGEQRRIQQQGEVALTPPSLDGEATALLARKDYQGYDLWLRANGANATQQEISDYQSYIQKYANVDENALNYGLALPGELAVRAAQPVTNLLPKGIPGVPGVNPQGIAEGAVRAAPYAAEAALLTPALGAAGTGALFSPLGAMSEQQSIDAYRNGDISGLRLGLMTAANLAPFIVAVAPALSGVLSKALQRAGTETSTGVAPRLILGTGGDTPNLTFFPEENAYVISGVKPSELASFRSVAENHGLTIGGGSGEAELGLVNAPEPTKLSPSMTAAEEFAAAKNGTAGGAIRAIADFGAKVDAALSESTAGRIAPAMSIAKWFSEEADRFQNPETHAVRIYQRDVASAQAFGASEGRKVGNAFDSAFKGGADATFTSPVTNQTITVRGHTLTNADVAEAYGHFSDQLSPRQVAVLKTIRANEDKLIAPARAEGATVGQAPNIMGDPAHVYIPRTVTSIKGESGRVFSQELQNRGMSGTTIEGPREHVTRVEGHEAGVRYAQSTAEEFTRHYQSVATTRALLALKTRLDQSSQTLKQRLVERNPAAANAPKRAADVTRNAKAVLRERTATVRVRNIKAATRQFRQARNAVLRGQRNLAKATTAPKLEGAKATGPNGMAIGAAREAVQSAYNVLHEQTLGSVRANVPHPTLDASLSENWRALENVTTSAGDTPAVNAAKLRLRIAQRRLDALTTQGALEPNNPSRQKLVESVGKMREELAAAHRDLIEATDNATDLLKGNISDADRQAIMAAQSLVKQGIEGQKAARRQYQAGMAGVKPLANEILSPGNLSITQGRIFSAEGAQPIMELEKANSVHAVVTALSHATLPLRFALATLDNSLVLNQAWNSMLASPPRWARMFANSWFVAASDKYWNHWLGAHKDAQTWLMKYAPDVFENADYAPRGNPIATAAGKVARVRGVGTVAKVAAAPVAYAERAFSRARLMTAVYLAELWRDPAMTNEEQFSLGSTITKLAGTARKSGPESALAFAARNARAQIGIGLDAISHGGVQGARARNIVMRQILAATAITALAGVLAGKNRDEIRKSLIITDPHSFHVGGFDLFGANRPLVNLLASFGDSIRWDVADRSIMPTRKWLSGPLGSGYLRSKANPLIGNLINAVSGEDAIGRPTSFRSEFLTPKVITPITIQSFMQDRARGANLPLAILAETTGSRFSVPTPYAHLNDRLSELGLSPGDFFSERGTRDQMMKDHPELLQLYDDWRQSRQAGSTDQRQAEQIISDKEAQIQQVLNAVHSGQLAPTQIRSKVGDINKASAAIRAALLPDQAPHQNRLDPLYAFYDAPGNQAPEGGPDLTKVQTAIDGYLKEHPDLKATWDANQFVPVTNDPLEVALKLSQKAVNQPYTVGKMGDYSYFGVGDRVWKSLTSNPAMSRYHDVSDYTNKLMGAAIKAGIDPADAAAKDPLLNEYSTQLKQFHIALLSEHPEVGAALVVFYGVNLPNKNLSDDVNNRIATATRNLYASLGINTQ